MTEETCANCGYSEKAHLQRDLRGLKSYKICKKFKPKCPFSEEYQSEQGDKTLSEFGITIDKDNHTKLWYPEDKVKNFIKELKEADIIGRKMLLEVIDKRAGKNLI